MMFAFFALAGDVGCSVGPTYVGTVTSLSDGNMKQGILLACVFPILLLAGLMAVRKVVENKENPSLGIQ